MTHEFDLHRHDDDGGHATHEHRVAVQRKRFHKWAERLGARLDREGPFDVRELCSLFQEGQDRYRAWQDA